MKKQKSSSFKDELVKNIKYYGVISTVWYRFHSFCVVEHPVISQILIPAVVAAITTILVKRLIGR